MLDEPDRARIRIARDAGGNQTRQAGLDDTENKMAMTAGNAKVHGDFRQRKARASAATLDHVDVPAASRQSPSIRPNVAAKASPVVPK